MYDHSQNQWKARPSSSILITNHNFLLIQIECFSGILQKNSGIFSCWKDEFWHRIGHWNRFVIFANCVIKIKWNEESRKIAGKRWIGDNFLKVRKCNSILFRRFSLPVGKQSWFRFCTRYRDDHVFCELEKKIVYCLKSKQKALCVWKSQFYLSRIYQKNI